MIFQSHVEDHNSYAEFTNSITEWLNKAEKELKANSDTHGERQTIESRLVHIKTITEAKEDRLRTFTAAMTAGEKLYPNTSTTGRSTITKEMHSLRNRWETFLAGLNDAEVSLETSLLQSSGLAENVQHLATWLKNCEEGLGQEVALVSLLQEKQTMLQTYKVFF